MKKCSTHFKFDCVTDFSGSRSEVKQKVEVSGFNLDECKSVYQLMRARLDGKRICAGGVENKDSCEGDSGDSIDFKI